MKGIYLTPEGKQEIEAKIAELIIELKSSEETDEYGAGSVNAAFDVYQKILSSATILPIEESYVSSKYPNGVIIQPKQ